MTALKNTGIVLALILGPLFLGLLFIQPTPPIGRTTRSATRVGHKVLYTLLEELGYGVRRFERGLETPPEDGAVLVALEPGPSLFREHGRYAQGLLEWIARGNTALISLGPDPDRDAEGDDRELEGSENTRRALRMIRELEQRTRTAQETEEPSEKDEESGSDSLFEQAPVDPSTSWDSDPLMVFLELPFRERRLPMSSAQTSTLSGAWTHEALEDPHVRLTRPRVFAPVQNTSARRGTQVLLELDEHPLLLGVKWGGGTLFVLSEPRLFQNSALLRESHALLAVRVVERLSELAKTRTIYFEEFSHGGRESTNIVDLALHSGARWPIFQLLLACGVWIAMVARRRRSAVPRETLPRRSRQEVVDAMASLFLRAGDTRGAAERLVVLTAHRTGKTREEVQACLPTEAVATERALVEHAARLRKVRLNLDDQR